MLDKGDIECPLHPKLNSKIINIEVAVGMPVTRHPPLRSVHEELPHTAPALGYNAKPLEGVWVFRFSRGYPRFDQPPEPHPGKIPCFVAATPHSVQPRPYYLGSKGISAASIAGHAIIVEVTLHHRS